MGLADSKCEHKILPKNGLPQSLEFVLDGSIAHPVYKSCKKQVKNSENEEDLKEQRECLWVRSFS